MKNKLFISTILSITLSGCLDLNPISEIGEESGRNQHRGDMQSKRRRRNVPETVQSRSYG